MCERINVVYQFNEKYAPYAAVSMASLFENNKSAEGISIYVLGEGLSEDSRGKLLSLAEGFARELVFVETEALVDKMKELNLPSYRGSYAANMRLFLADLLPVGRVIYLDADTVVAGSLEPLMKLSLEGKALGMVLDSLCGAHKEEIGLSPEVDYYNSGMVLFDLTRWKELSLSERMIEHITKVRAQYPSPDQDLLNVVCQGHILRLDAKYNFQPVHQVFDYASFVKDFKNSVYYTAREIAAAKENVVVYHFLRFVGEFPWDKGSIHPYTPLFDRYLALTPWADYEKIPAQNGLVLKIEKILYLILPKKLFLWIFSIAHRSFYKRANRLSEKNKISSAM